MEANEEFEKGKLSSAFNYSDMLKFKKTGKDIKEKIVGQIARIEANIDIIERDIIETAEGCVGQPSETLYQYGIGSAIKCPYKKFHYCLADHWEGRDLNQPYSLETGGQIYPSATSDEAMPYRKYNELVEKWYDEQRELQLIRLFENNFEDSDKYELNAEQMLALGF